MFLLVIILQLFFLVLDLLMLKLKKKIKKKKKKTKKRGLKPKKTKTNNPTYVKKIEERRRQAGSDGSDTQTILHKTDKEVESPAVTWNTRASPSVLLLPEGLSATCQPPCHTPTHLPCPATGWPATTNFRHSILKFQEKIHKVVREFTHVRCRQTTCHTCASPMEHRPEERTRRLEVQETTEGSPIANRWFCIERRRSRTTITLQPYVVRKRRTLTSSHPSPTY